MKISDKILCCTIETDPNGAPPHGYLCEQSSQRVGIDLTLFGGEWKKWENFNTKYEILLEELPKYKDEYDLVLFTDSRDVMYWKRKHEILRALEKFKDYKMVVNAETNCYPNKDLDEPQKKLEKGKYRYLNSGMYVGEIDYVIWVLKKCVELNLEDDQESLQKVYIENSKDIKLDSNCELFQVLWDEEYGRSANFDMVFNYDSGSRYNQRTDTYPAIFHSPGPTGHLNQLDKVNNDNFGGKYKDFEEFT